MTEEYLTYLLKVSMHGHCDVHNCENKVYQRPLYSEYIGNICLCDSHFSKFIRAKREIKIPE